jgi:hypothetical protein
MLLCSATHELMVAADSISLGIGPASGAAMTTANLETSALSDRWQPEFLPGPAYDSTTNRPVQRRCSPPIDEADIDFYLLATNGNLQQRDDIETAICHST